MTNYYRLMLGQKSMYAAQCLQYGFIGVDYQITQDLTYDLPDIWQDFNKKFTPLFLEQHPEKSKIAAGLACGAVWTLSKGMKIGDIILAPNGQSEYMIGEVISDYIYQSDSPLPHQRAVIWRPGTLKRSAMSIGLKNSTGSVGVISNITKYATELEGLLDVDLNENPTLSAEFGEEELDFVLEKYLEEFLVANWKHTALGKDYDIYSDGGEVVGQQYKTDTGPLDILAISKDKKTLLVVELKRGRASDVVVGQILRYMGFVSKSLSEEGQSVKGVVIALEDDLKIRNALSMVPSISFYRYKVNFQLIPI